LTHDLPSSFALSGLPVHVAASQLAPFSLDRNLENQRFAMFRFIAFLRAINVGRGRTVKMRSLRQVFESLGLSKVATFIASGNVVFETRTKKTKILERKIEGALKEALGYEVRTFVRGETELAKIANYQPFPQSVRRNLAEQHHLLGG
jgi:uncharacterized protein (DUF1697 family)